MRRQVTPKLLRVCNFVNEEASPIFYGQNEFRFTGLQGWIVLNSFLRTIGRTNRNMLRHLTVNAPGLDEHYEGVNTASRFQPDLKRGHLMSQVFHNPVLEILSVVDLIRKKMPRLRMLDFVSHSRTSGPCPTRCMSGRDRADYYAVEDLVNLVDHSCKIAIVILDRVNKRYSMDQVRAESWEVYQSLGLPFYKGEWKEPGSYFVDRSKALTAAEVEEQIERPEDNDDD